MNSRKFTPLKLTESFKVRYTSKQPTSFSPRLKKSNRENFSNFNDTLDGLFLPKIKFKIKSSFLTNLIKSKGREQEGTHLSSTRNDNSKKSFSISPKIHIRKHPARFKEIERNNYVKNSDSAVFQNKEDIQLIQSLDSDNIRKSIERTKKVMNLEGNMNKNTILKIKDKNWKWSTPAVTPLKTVRFADDR